jgi:hypothetical protein
VRAPFGDMVTALLEFLVRKNGGRTGPTKLRMFDYPWLDYWRPRSAGLQWWRGGGDIQSPDVRLGEQEGYEQTIPLASEASHTIKEPSDERHSIQWE